MFAPPERSRWSSSRARSSRRPSRNLGLSFSKRNGSRLGGAGAHVRQPDTARNKTAAASRPSLRRRRSVRFGRVVPARSRAVSDRSIRFMIRPFAFAENGDLNEKSGGRVWQIGRGTSRSVIRSVDAGRQKPDDSNVTRCGTCMFPRCRYVRQTVDREPTISEKAVPCISTY